jgi:hypothetical protein
VNARLLTVALIVALMPAAGRSSGKAEEERELQLNRAKWEQRGISSYQILLHHECFCPPPWSGPFRVTVRGRKVTKVVYEGQNADGYWPGRVVSKKHMTDLTLTIEDIFKEAEKAINSPPELSSFGLQHQPHKIRYHPEYGFPTLIDVENPPRVADAQWRLVVDEFRPGNR